jgi:hypothetical protein
VIVAFELIFIVLLGIILFMVFSNDGFGLKKKFRAAKIRECWNGENRRLHPRFTQALELSYSIKKGADAKGKTVDISQGGAKIVLDEKIPPGAILKLKIVLPNPGKITEVSGEVVWTEDAKDIKESAGKRFFYSGIKFVRLTDSSSSKHLIDCLQSQFQTEQS